MISTSDPRLAVYAGARAVITGGMGLIGSAIARRLVAQGAEVLLVDSMIPEYGGNRANIADIKCPRSVDFAHELPRDPTGKLHKRLLRDRYRDNYRAK